MPVLDIWDFNWDNWLLAGYPNFSFRLIRAML
jgi:hypothetical protein